jgi:hypothetical protein
MPNDQPNSTPIDRLITEIKRALRAREHIKDDAGVWPMVTLQISDWRAVLMELERECEDAL